MNIAGRIDQLGMTRLPHLRNLLKQLQETGPAMALARWKVSSAEEGFEVRRQENIERPAARAGGRLHKGHINLIHIGPLFAVHFDADEMLVQEPGHFLALEGFSFHHVTPMASRVTNADEDRLVLLPRFGERFLAPREPVHRVELVL